MNLPNLLVFICSKAACEVLNAPVRWTSMMVFQSSSELNWNLKSVFRYSTWNSQEGSVTEDASVVHDNVDFSKAINCSLDKLITVSDGVVVRHCLASVWFDKLNNGICSRVRCAVTISSSTEIVDDYACSSWSKLQRNFKSNNSALKFTPAMHILCPDQRLLRR